jgi:hypothetical protein
MTTTLRAIGVLLALSAGLSAMFYSRRRWTKGWGSLIVPIPAYNLVSLSDIEASLSRHGAAEDKTTGDFQIRCASSTMLGCFNRC